METEKTRELIALGLMLGAIATVALKLATGMDWVQAIAYVVLATIVWLMLAVLIALASR